MNTLHWIASGTLVVLSFLIICANFWIAIRWYLFRKRGTMIPFIGGIIGMIGLLLLPMVGVRRFWWTPLVADLGCGLMMLGIAIESIKRVVRRNHSGPDHGVS